MSSKYVSRSPERRRNPESKSILEKLNIVASLFDFISDLKHGKNKTPKRTSKPLQNHSRQLRRASRSILKPRSVSRGFERRRFSKAEFKRNTIRVLLALAALSSFFYLVEENTDFKPVTFVAQIATYLFGGAFGEAKVTAYSCGGLNTEAEIKMNCPSMLYGPPRTASGTTPIARLTMACDKEYMGNVYFIEGVGAVKCTDTGGRIKGPGRFDLYLSSVDEAREWGVKYLKYIIVKD